MSGTLTPTLTRPHFALLALLAMPTPKDPPNNPRSSKPRGGRNGAAKEGASALALKPVGGKVIHVAFGAGGGRLAQAPALLVPDHLTDNAAEGAGEPQLALFTRKEVFRLLGLPVAKLS